MQSEADMKAAMHVIGLYFPDWRVNKDALNTAVRFIIEAAQSPASAVEVVTVEELANRLVIEGRSPDSAEVMLDHVHIGYWKARLERLAKMFPNGIRIIKPESE